MHWWSVSKSYCIYILALTALHTQYLMQISCLLVTGVLLSLARVTTGGNHVTSSVAAYPPISCYDGRIACSLDSHCHVMLTAIPRICNMNGTYIYIWSMYKGSTAGRLRLSCIESVGYPFCDATLIIILWFGLLGFNASATARVISRRWNDDDEISYLVEETGVPGGNHRPTASNWWNFETDETDEILCVPNVENVAIFVK